MRQSTFRTLLIILILCAACKSQDSQTVATQQADSDMAILASSDLTPGLSLLSTGEEPRHTIRYDFPENATFPGTMKMKMDIVLTIDGAQAPSAKLPTSVLPITISTTAKNEEWIALRAIHGETSLEDTKGVQEVVQTALLDQMSQLAGLTIEWEINNRGNVRNISTLKSDQLSNQVKQLVEQTEKSFRDLFIMFPDEPIGVGARWINDIPNVTFGGISQEIKTLYTVKQIGNDSLTVDLLIQSSIKEQSMSLPQEHLANITAKVFPAKNYSRGVTVIKLKSPIPDASITSDTRIAMELSGGPLNDKTQKTETAVKMEVTIQPDP